jgi:hypothetical protein
MLTIGIILIIVSILLVIYSVHSLRNVHQINQNIDKQNQELQQEHDKLIKNLDVIKKKFFNENQNYRDIKQEVLVANKELIETKRHLNDIQNNIIKTTETQKELSQKAFENYCEVLNKQYEEQEAEYNIYKNNLVSSYEDKQLELMEELEQVQKELDSIKSTRAAAIQAQLKEKEIKEKLSFYCLTISQTNLDDIKVLERIKPQLHEPRILSMLIWKTYFQKPMTTLCNNVLGTDIICGIYKITNQLDDMCYIGQSVNVSDRFKQHAKCGLGIDTPPGNKLYKAMIEDGLWNFSFELLEKCPKEQLNEKERYYIDLYQSEKFGYNILKGNNT